MLPSFVCFYGGITASLCCVYSDEIDRNELGSRPLLDVLESMQPSYWFSAHMHVKFAAYVTHTTDVSRVGK